MEMSTIDLFECLVTRTSFYVFPQRNLNRMIFVSRLSENLVFTLTRHFRRQFVNFLVQVDFRIHYHL